MIDSSTTMRSRQFALGGALAVLAACQPRDHDPIRIEHAWAHASPPGATVGAAYMWIVSQRADTLAGATSPAAERVEMHVSVEENGTMRMRPLDSVELRPNEPFTFTPAGAHFMLIGLNKPLAAESGIPLTLRFRAAGDRAVTVRVIAPGSEPAP